jgi:hypothetical protein
MLYISKKRAVAQTYWTNDGVTVSEWSISGLTATYGFGLPSRGTGVLHGPLLAEGSYVDVFLNTGFTGSTADTSSVAFLGASSTYGNFSYQSGSSNYASIYWSGIKYVNGNNTGSTFQLNGNTYYRISRSVGSNPGVNTNIRVSKIDSNGNITTAGTDMTITFNNNMHVVLLGQQGYNISSISFVRQG